MAEENHLWRFENHLTVEPVTMAFPRRCGRLTSMQYLLSQMHGYAQIEVRPKAVHLLTPLKTWVAFQGYPTWTLEQKQQQQRPVLIHFGSFAHHVFFTFFTFFHTICCSNIGWIRMSPTIQKTSHSDYEDLWSILPTATWDLSWIHFDSNMQHNVLGL